MKIVFSFLLTLVYSSFCFGQINWSQTLSGTWKVENQEQYEHWDILNNNSLKGYSYAFVNNLPQVMEYLSLDLKGNKWTYTASVKGQNGGNPISFKANVKDSTFIVTNPKHDFPKTIIYQYKNESTLVVTLSDNQDKKFTYNLNKVSPSTKNNTVSGNPNYDEALAKELNGDDYGMKAFYLVILKSGANTSTDANLRNESFKQHLANINRLVEEKKMVVAGPLGKNDNSYRGIFIFHNIKSKEELSEILNSDMAIKNNYLTYEIYDWYGSAALPVYLKAADKIWKAKP